jgi:hypothetical protein
MGQADKSLRGGDEGNVVRIIAGYPEHACPDHDEAPDCVCGGETGRVRACAAGPVVAWETREGGTIERCISPEDEGTDWERVR